MFKRLFDVYLLLKSSVWKPKKNCICQKSIYKKGRKENITKYNTERQKSEYVSILTQLKFELIGKNETIMIIYQ